MGHYRGQNYGHGHHCYVNCPHLKWRKPNASKSNSHPLAICPENRLLGAACRISRRSYLGDSLLRYCHAPGMTGTPTELESRD